MSDVEVVGPAPRVPAVPERSLPPRGEDEASKVMTLVDHLTELRRRIAISGVAVLVGTIIGFVLAPQAVLLLLQPVPSGQVYFFTVGGGFFIQMKIAVVIGVAIALPVVLHQLWAFVAPGLTARERRTARPWIPLAIVFFLLGVAVAYVTLPFAVAFLTGFQIPGRVTYFPNAEAYFGFITTLFLAFGAVMEFPIALVLLSKLGILTVERLRTSRRYVFVGIVVFAVVVTPGGDPISPTVLSSVMYVLYELTILMLRRSAASHGASGGG